MHARRSPNGMALRAAVHPMSGNDLVPIGFSVLAVHRSASRPLASIRCEYFYVHRHPRIRNGFFLHRRHRKTRLCHRQGTNCSYSRSEWQFQAADDLRERPEDRHSAGIRNSSKANARFRNSAAIPSRRWCKSLSRVQSQCGPLHGYTGIGIRHRHLSIYARRQWANGALRSHCTTACGRHC